MGEPLAGLRVLEHSGDVATRYCGRLFAAWGAEVIRVASGDDARLGYAGAAGRAYGVWLDQRKTVFFSGPRAGNPRSGDLAPFGLIIAGEDGPAIAAAEAGLAAAPVQAAHHLCDDPQLMASGYWVELERSVIGRHLVPATPFRFDGVRPPLRRPAPTLGQHTDEVLAELL